MITVPGTSGEMAHVYRRNLLTNRSKEKIVGHINSVNKGSLELPGNGGNERKSRKRGDPMVRRENHQDRANFFLTGQLIPYRGPRKTWVLSLRELSELEGLGIQ